jgi:hypothetical protein
VRALSDGIHSAFIISDQNSNARLVWLQTIPHADEGNFDAAKTREGSRRLAKAREAASTYIDRSIESQLRCESPIVSTVASPLDGTRDSTSVLPPLSAIDPSSRRRAIRPDKSPMHGLKNLSYIWQVVKHRSGISDAYARRTMQQHVGRDLFEII